LTQATEEQKPKRHKTKASLVFSDTIPKDLATLSRRIVGINAHKQLSVTNGLFIFGTSIVICGQLRLQYQRLLLLRKKRLTNTQQSFTVAVCWQAGKR
jgi:hypothetical protein